MSLSLKFILSNGEKKSKQMKWSRKLNVQFLGFS